MLNKYRPRPFPAKKAAKSSSAFHGIRGSKLGRFWRGESLAFFSVFLLGLLFFWVQLFTWAIPQVVERQNYVPVQAIVQETKIEEDSSQFKEKTPPGTHYKPLYKPVVLVAYDVHAMPYRVWAFDLHTQRGHQGFHHDKESAERAIKPFHVGQKIPCWYHKADPTKAVIVWPVPVFGVFLLLLSFSFVVLGLVGFVQSFRSDILSPERKISSANKPKNSPIQSLVGGMPQSAWPTVPDDQLINESPGTNLAFRLPLGSQPFFPFLGYTLLTVAVNAVAWSVLVHSAFNAELERMDWPLETALRIAFCLVGVALFVGLAQKILAALRLGPTLLEISDHPLYPGRRYRILLQQSGALRFHRLAIDLVCEEIARFRQGTDTVTSRKDVFRQTLFAREDFETTPALPLNQEFFVQIPRGAMHSLRLENNEILWKLHVSATTAVGPNFFRECPVIVRPAPRHDPSGDGDWEGIIE